MQARLAALEAENAALRSSGGGSRRIVTLQGRELGLVQVPSLADRWHILINVSRAGREEPAAWAALGLTHPELRHRVAYVGDLLAYGRQIAAVLLDDGIPMGEINRAARVAISLVTDGIPNVGGASDFSATSPGGSAGGGGSSEPSSRSSAPGDASTAGSPASTG